MKLNTKGKLDFHFGCFLFQRLWRLFSFSYFRIVQARIRREHDTKEEKKNKRNASKIITSIHSACNSFFLRLSSNTKAVDSLICGFTENILRLVDILSEKRR